MAEAGVDHQKHVRTYIVVFAALAVLTIVTVAISYLDLATGPAIALAIAIATVKASLVMGFFMHLINEKQIITSILVLTALFFVVLLLFPALTSGGGA